MKKTIFLISIFLVILLTVNVSAITIHDETQSYFSDYELGLEWANNPVYMIDGNNGTFASTTIDNEIESLNKHNISLLYDNIEYVHIRCYAYCSVYRRGVILLVPNVDGTNFTSNYKYTPNTSPAWSEWFDITNDTYAPSPWIWDDIKDMTINISAKIEAPCTLYCARVEIKVGYNYTNNPPVITNHNPSNNSIWNITYNCNNIVYSRDNTSIMLCANFSDPEGGPMDITCTFEKGTGPTIYGVYNGTYCFNLSAEFPDDLITFGNNNEWGFLVTDNINPLVANSSNFTVNVINQCCDSCQCSDCPNITQTIYYNYSDDNITYFNVSIYHDFNNDTCIHVITPNQNGYNLNITIGNQTLTLSFNTGQFAFMIIASLVFAIFIFAEWKRDFIYFLISCALMIELGILTLTMPKINIYASIIIFGVASYHMILSLLHIPVIRKLITHFRETTE